MEVVGGDGVPERFILRVQRDGSVCIEIGHSFSECDIPAMIAAQHELERLIPRPRGTLRAAR